MAKRKEKYQFKVFQSIFDLRLLLLVFLSFLLVSIFTVSDFIQTNKSTSIKIKAEDCSGNPDASGGNCDSSNPCRWSCNEQLNNNPFNTPSCCEDIRRTGDPTLCCFDALRFCTPDQCSTIPEGVKRQRCAQLWELNCCPVYGEGCELTPPNITPAPRVSPTNPPPTNPSPTNPPPQTNPSPIPSDTPGVSYPTNTPNPSYPTDTPVPIFPTSSSYVSPTVYNPPPGEQPTTYNPPPGEQPTLIPSPTVKPMIKTILSDVGNFLQKTKESFLKFFSVVLP